MSSECQNRWLIAGKDLSNRAYNPESRISRTSLGREASVKRTRITDGDNWIGSTCDEHHVYVTSRNAEEGEILCINRQDLNIKWKRKISCYTGVVTDNSTSAPAIHEDLLIIGTSLLVPQTFATPDNEHRKGYNLYTGKEIHNRGQPPSLLCINKHTGDLIWKTHLGLEAKYMYSKDNNMVIIQSPTIFQIQYNGQPLWVIGVGTSSVQSFIPMVSSPSWYTTFRPQPQTARNFYQEDYQRTMTDVGKYAFFRLDTGELLTVTSAGPPRYLPGHTMRNDAPVDKGGGYLYPGRRKYKIFRWLSSCDVDELNKGVSKQYAGLQKFTFTLENNFGLGTKTVPRILNGLVVSDRGGNPITLIGGQVITNRQEGVVVSVMARIKKGSTSVCYNGCSYHFNCDFVGARCYKWLRDGDVLDTQDAYYANYYGADISASTSAVVDQHVYIATCEATQIPAEDLEEYTVLDTNYITDCKEVRRAQDKYFRNSTRSNWLEASESVKVFNETIDKQKMVARSPRAQRFHHSSIIKISLEDGCLGNVVAYHHSMGYDVWHAGYSQMRLGALGKEELIPINVRGSEYQYRTLYTDIQDWIGGLVSPVGGFSAGPVIVGNKIVACNKMANCYILDLNLNVIRRIRQGIPGLLGGASFGICADDRRVYCNQANSQYTGCYNLKVQSANWGSRYPLPQVIPDSLDWFSNSYVTSRDHSYITCVDVETGTMIWMSRVIPGSEQAVTATAISCNKDLVFVPDGLGWLRVFDSSNGILAARYPLEHAGSARPILVGNELHIANGGGFLSPFSSTSKFSSTNFMTSIYFHCQ